MSVSNLELGLLVGISLLGLGSILIFSPITMDEAKTIPVSIISNTPTEMDMSFVDTNPKPISSYPLNGDTNDVIGNNELILSSDVGDDGWYFSEEDTAKLYNMDMFNYGIEMVFYFDDSDQWSRILDYHNHTAFRYENDIETGVYVNQSNEIDLYDWDSGGNVIAGEETHIFIQRNSTSGFVHIYQDGNEAAKIFDTNYEYIFDKKGLAIFFKDNPDNELSQNTVPNEDSSGFLDCLNIYDETLTHDQLSLITSNPSECYY